MTKEKAMNKIVMVYMDVQLIVNKQKINSTLLLNKFLNYLNGNNRSDIESSVCVVSITSNQHSWSRG